MALDLACLWYEAAPRPNIAPPRGAARAPTAYHEAGHAVVAWYCGATIGNVSMEPDQDHGIGGYARHGDGDREWGDLGILFRFSKEHGVIVEEPDGTLRLPTDAEREHNTITDECVELESWERGVMIAAAGEAAERIVAPESFHPIHSSADRREALPTEPEKDEVYGTVETHPQMSDEDRDAWVAPARRFLRKPLVWQLVDALAGALIARTTLTGREVQGVLRGCFA